MCRALPANWGCRDSNNLLQRTCNSIPLFTSRDGCSTYTEATLLALLDGHVESCSMQALNVIAENFLLQEVVSFLKFTMGMCVKKPGGLGRSKGVTVLRNYEVIVFSLWNQTWKSLADRKPWCERVILIGEKKNQLKKMEPVKDASSEELCANVLSC